MTNEQAAPVRSLKDSIAWEILKILLVPAVLTLFGLWLNKNANQRERMQSYIASTAELAEQASSEGKSKIGDSPALRSLVRLRTLLLLDDLDDKSKRHVVEFLANSDVHYQISLENADLSGADLSGLTLWHADLRNADLRGAKLDNADLSGASLAGIRTGFDVQSLRSTTMDGLMSDECTIIPKSLTIKRIPGSLKKEPCRYNDNGIHKSLTRKYRKF